VTPQIDPQARAVMDHIASLGLPAFDQISPSDARRIYRETRGPLRPQAPDLFAVRDLSAWGPASAGPAARGPIPLRLYRPAEGVLPALIYFHGGGWVVGDLDTHDVVCRQIAAQSGAIVIAVDYRLAPEHRFPAAIEDAWSATTWIAAHAGELGIDAARMAVGGDSAGGGLAAAVTLMARDAGAPAIAYQVLVYPVTDLRAESDSYSAYADGYMLTRSAMKWYISQYAPDAASWRDWRGSPLLAESMRALPPALILAAQCDPLLSEGAQYARRLEQADVPVEYIEYEGMIHGFLTMGGKIDAAQRAIATIAMSLRRALA
jgi:acetyl esterase